MARNDAPPLARSARFCALFGFATECRKHALLEGVESFGNRLHANASAWCVRLIGLALACRSTGIPGVTGDVSGQERATLGLASDARDARDVDANAAADLAVDAGASYAEVSDDPAEAHVETKEALVALVTLRTFTEAERKRIAPEPFLARVFGIGDPQHVNQGNKAISHHRISQRACLRGLEGMTLQTPEQRAACGYENMVPVHLAGKSPYFCVDIFEFPNKACELPYVWVPPTYAESLCQLQGKRLCSQTEWQIACRGDPEDGPDSKYAYGEALDLSVCNTERAHEQPCITTSANRAFATCGTQTEPSGAFPHCRSRFGAFDLHGNVAEIMKRRDYDGSVVSQLKGSAFFYAAIAREPGAPSKLSQKGMETYPDHCNFDPRWHVEAIENAWHVNYHLGFRCCKNIP
jgi:formylglycine-generating enzyme